MLHLKSPSRFLISSRPSDQRIAHRPLPNQLTLHASKGFGSSTKSKPCPCDSGNEYDQCCKRLHDNQLLKASSPLQQLRARFSAYSQKQYKYIVRTTHQNNAARAGSTATDGKIATSFEQDVKVTAQWADFSELVINGETRPVNLPGMIEAADIEFE